VTLECYSSSACGHLFKTSETISVVSLDCVGLSFVSSCLATKVDFNFRVCILHRFIFKMIFRYTSDHIKRILNSYIYELQTCSLTFSHMNLGECTSVRLTSWLFSICVTLLVIYMQGEITTFNGLIYIYIYSY
jgi:hypothetical protein